MADDETQPLQDETQPLDLDNDLDNGSSSGIATGGAPDDKFQIL